MYIIFFCFLINISSITAEDISQKKETKREFKDWRYKDYIKKFEAGTVWERFAKDQREKKLSAENYTSRKYIDLMINGMDAAEDLMKLKIENVALPEIPQTVDEMMTDARRWRPPKGLNDYPKDRHFLRQRLYELMRQAIYQARNALVTMQIMREKYRDSSLYKMGFLMSKTDNAVKTFSKFAYRAFKLCGLSRAVAVQRVHLYDVLVTEERLLHLWYNAQLLIELVMKNDYICSQMLYKHQYDRINQWKFED